MSVFRFGRHEVDLDRHEVRRDGRCVSTEPQVFDVLAHLIRHRDRVVTKEELLDAVWGDRFVSDSALTSRIKAARRAVGDDGTAQAVIRTVHRRGYRFIAEVVEQADDDRSPTARTDPSGSGPPAVPAPRTRYAASAGHAIAYQIIDDRSRSEDGEALDDLVFVPGFVSNVELQWELPLMAEPLRRLGRGRRLVVFDKRGTGVSERVAPDRLPTLEDRIDDVRAVMDAVGIERASLFGVSEGGPMTVLFAATHPERVARLSIFGSYAARPFHDLDDLLERTRQFWGSGTAFEFLAPSMSKHPELRRFFARFERLSATPDAAAAIVAMADAIDIRPVLGAVAVPTQILHRRGDVVFEIDRARELATGIPGAELVELPGVDHFFFWDPEPALVEIERFLGQPAPDGVRERVLTSLVVVTGAPPDDDAVASALDALGPSRPASVSTVQREGDLVIVPVEGPARAVRLAQRLVVGGATAAGVHTAEVEVAGQRFGGVGVEVACQVARRAAVGQVLVTRTLTDLVAGSGIEFDYRGAESLSDGERHWELYEPRPR